LSIYRRIRDCKLSKVDCAILQVNIMGYATQIVWIVSPIAMSAGLEADQWHVISQIDGFFTGKRIANAHKYTMTNLIFNKVDAMTENLATIPIKFYGSAKPLNA
jgi:hypothetical protein